MTIQTEPDHEKEGVIKYQLHFHKMALSDYNSSHPVFTRQKFGDLLEVLNTSRTQLKKAGLIGQDAARYNGDGFGNISVRLEDERLLISGSQTGHLSTLSMNDVAVIDSFDLKLNQLVAFGVTKPSSESLTHGVCYQTYNHIKAVVHVHSPDIWQALESLGLPYTAQNIPYGTPEMAEAVRELLVTHHQEDQPTIFGMKGHQDGVVALGKSLTKCTSSLLECLNQTLFHKRSSR